MALPAAYVQRCAPLRLAALSPSGAHLAVAGRQGAALTSLDAPRWRFFGAGGGAAEASMRAAALCWLGADALLLPAHSPSRASWTFSGDRSTGPVGLSPCLFLLAKNEPFC